MPGALCFLFFFFNDPATTEIYTLPLHDALPILLVHRRCRLGHGAQLYRLRALGQWRDHTDVRGRAELSRRLAFRSEEHTSELQSQSNLVCRLLLEKKKNNQLQYNDIETHVVPLL